MSWKKYRVIGVNPENACILQPIGVAGPDSGSGLREGLGKIIIFKYSLSGKPVFP